MLINTDQGNKYITGTLRSEQSYEKVIKQNPMITASLIKDPRRDTFIRRLQSLRCTGRAKTEANKQIKDMRIGLLTLPLETGYGSILQAYALKTVLTRQGHEVILIRRLVKKSGSTAGTS